MAVHRSITESRVIRLIRSNESKCENRGLCINCGESADGCEPDARGYKCPNCNSDSLYGAEELLLTNQLAPAPAKRPLPGSPLSQFHDPV